ncbi:MAG: molybdopterin-guanine dinucleotide biosynthesis protein B [Halorhodospira sp.]
MHTPDPEALPPAAALDRAAAIGPPGPVIAVTGLSGAGKTTLISGAVEQLRRSGWRPAVVKHAHHGLDLDRPGKDSHRVREAGAEQVLIVSAQRWALLSETPTEERDDLLSERLRALDWARTDIVLAEGFRHSGAGKLVVDSVRSRPADYRHDPAVLAVATDDPATVPDRLPCLDLDDHRQVAAFLIRCARGMIERMGVTPHAFINPINQ